MAKLQFKMGAPQPVPATGKPFTPVFFHNEYREEDYDVFGSITCIRVDGLIRQIEYHIVMAACLTSIGEHVEAAVELAAGYRLLSVAFGLLMPSWYA